MRGSGRWNRVEADLLAATDADPRMAGLGRSGVLNWLQSQAATTWDVLPGAQRDRIGDLLDRSGLSDGDRHRIAFHVGLAGPDAAAQRPAGWRRLLRRG
jgi:hypothetical protein